MLQLFREPHKAKKRKVKSAMKRILIVLALSLLFVILSINCFAATPTASLAASSTSVAANSSVTITVKVSNCSSASLGIIPEYDTNTFELVSGEILVSGAVLSDFSDGCAVMAFASVNNFNGDVFRFVLKAKSSANPGSYTVKCEVQAEGYSTVYPSITLTVPCTNHKWGEWTQTKAPTCGVKGSETHTCSVCGAKENRDIPALEHNWSSWNQTTAPGCDTKGAESRTCSICEKTETRSINATGHKWGEYTLTKAPTCTVKGTETRTCSVCKKTETRDIAAKGHTWDSWTQITAPTCGTKGSESHSCSICGTKETRDIAATGQHKWGEWKQITAPGCETPGQDARYCTVCDAEEHRTINATGHDFEEPKLIRDATLSETGLIQGRCKNCGKTTDQIIPCQATDATTGIVVKPEEGAFDKGAELIVNKIDPGSTEYEKLKDALSNISPIFDGFIIIVNQNGDSVQPKKSVTVSVPVSNKYGNSAELFIINEGIARQLDFVFDDNNKTLTATVDSFGLIAVVDPDAEMPTDIPSNRPTEQPTEHPTENPTELSTQMPETDSPIETDTPEQGSNSDNKESDPYKTLSSTIAIIVLAVYSAIVSIVAIILAIALKKKNKS